MELIAQFDECPDCHVDAWLMKGIVQGEIAKGSMGEGVIPNTMTKLITNLDARKPPLVGGRVPSARVFYDICCKCGKEYIVRIEKGHITMPSRPGVAPVFA